MKTTRKFKGSWFLFAVAATIVIGEVTASKVATVYGIRTSPLVVGFVCAGLVAAIASVLYEGCDID